MTVTEGDVESTEDMVEGMLDVLDGVGRWTEREAETDDSQREAVR